MKSGILRYSLALLAIQAASASQPVITGATPNPIDAGGPYFPLTVTGTGFQPGAVISVPGYPMQTTFVSSTELQAEVTSDLRKTSGSLPLMIANPDGGRWGIWPVTVLPVIGAVTPAVALAGGGPVTITVTGLGLIARDLVVLGAGATQTTLATTFINSTTLTAVVPATLLGAAQSAGVEILDPVTGGHSLAQPFTIAAPSPAIATLIPITIMAGSAPFTLTVSGLNFSAGWTLQWNGAPLTATLVNSSQITASIATNLIAAAGTASIQLVNQNGGASNTAPFTISPAALITSASPSQVTAGTGPLLLTVNGVNFAPGSTILWNRTPLPAVWVSANQLTATVPESLIASASSAAIAIFSPGGAVSNSIGIPMNPATPTLTAASPSSVTAGGGAFTLTLTGTNLAVNCVVRWGATPLGTTFVSTTQVTVAVPPELIAAGGTASLTLTNPSGATTNALSFTVTVPPPVLAGINPSSATAGGPAFTLAVAGSNFLRNSVVTWNGAALQTSFGSANQLDAAVPAGLIAAAGMASVRVTTGGSSDSSAVGFTIQPPPPPGLAGPAGSASVVNAASGLPAIAPGSLISIYGPNLAEAESTAPSLPLPTSLNGTSVAIGGIAAPLVYVSRTQINAQVPFEIPVGIASMVIETPNGKSPLLKFPVAATGPGVFTVAGGNHAVAQNYPGLTVNSAQQPASPGQYVVVYLTGQGLVDQPVATGAQAPTNPLARPVAAIKARIGGQEAPIVFAGLAPSFAGLLQMNLIVPSVVSGEQPLEISVGGVPANQALISVLAP